MSADGASRSALPCPVVCRVEHTEQELQTPQSLTRALWQLNSGESANSCCQTRVARLHFP
eukprot:1257835-Amphidinium_carterae.1